MILGLDISTSITGYALVDENTGQLVEYGSFNLKKCKDVFDKALFMKGSLVELLEHHQVSKIFIEQPFTFFNSGGSSGKTMAALQRFNGIVSWIAYELLYIIPDYVGATQARKLCDIKVPRGQKAKQVVLEHLLKNEKSFKIEYTRYGNPKAESYDRADAIVIAKAGYKISQKTETA
jgi:Holliday junction resolvasome RuvABC endonuclease subunit